MYTHSITEKKGKACGAFQWQQTNQQHALLSTATDWPHVSCLFLSESNERLGGWMQSPRSSGQCFSAVRGDCRSQVRVGSKK